MAPRPVKDWQGPGDERCQAEEHTRLREEAEERPLEEIKMLKSDHVGRGIGKKSRYPCLGLAGGEHMPRKGLRRP